MGGGSLRLLEYCFFYSPILWVAGILTIPVPRLPADPEQAIVVVEAFMWAPQSR
jgi:hypothetical protein